MIYSADTIVKDFDYFTTDDDYRPRYIKLENGKWRCLGAFSAIPIDSIEYYISDESIGESKRFRIISAPDAKTNSFIDDLAKAYLEKNIDNFDSNFIIEQSYKDGCREFLPIIHKLSERLAWCVEEIKTLSKKIPVSQGYNTATEKGKNEWEQHSHNMSLNNILLSQIKIYKDEEV